jgi:colanic acid/amylovoran biosynthesis glycosyltransferase
MKKKFYLGLLALSFFLHATDRLKILMIVRSFPHAPRAYVNNQIAGLLDAGHEVFILAGRTGIIACPVYQKYKLADRTFYNDLPEDLRDFDVIYAQFGNEGLYGMNLMKQGYIRGKLMVSLRGDDITTNLHKNPHIYDELFNFADLFLPVCDFFANILKQHGCPQDKIKVLYSSIDCNQFTYYNRKKRRDKKKFKMITIGRLYRMKGFEYCIRALKIVKERYKNIKLFIIGQGPLHKKLKTLIKFLGLEKYVFLLGYKSQDEIITFLQQSDCFVYTPVTTNISQSDGIANVLKEAMATGLVPITTNHGGNSEIITDGINGMLVPEYDIKVIAKKIKYVIENRERGFSMGKHAAKFIRENFCKTKLTRDLINIMQNLVKS